MLSSSTAINYVYTVFDDRIFIMVEANIDGFNVFNSAHVKRCKLINAYLMIYFFRVSKSSIDIMAIQLTNR